MVAYSYKPRFVPLILDGAKDQTIRADRRSPSYERTRRFGGHAAPGEQLQHYVGMRTPQCRLVARTLCCATLPIHFVIRPIVEIIVDREKLDVSDMDPFAKRDGFSDLDDMLRFWSDTHDVRVFDGRVIRWPRVNPEAGKP